MPIPSLPDTNVMVRIRAEMAALRLRFAFERLRMKAGFNPNQPRAPAGNPDGGQWTAGEMGRGPSARLGRGRRSHTSATTSADGSLSTRFVRDRTGDNPWSSYTESRRRSDGKVVSRTVTNRDGSRIDAEPLSPRAERNTVTLKDGVRFTFENDGDTFRVIDSKGHLISEVVWTAKGPKPQPILTPVFRDPRTTAIERAVQAGLTLYGWWMSSKKADEEIVFGFNAYELQPGSETLPPFWVGKRTREEVKKACKRLKHVQDATDEAAVQSPKARFQTNAVRGTAIHVKVRDAVIAQHDPNYKAEESILKSRAEAPAELTKYGRKGSIRVDVLERRSDDVVCVYDIKTGRSLLTRARYLEILGEVASAFPTAKRIIVVQVKPAE